MIDTFFYVFLAFLTIITTFYSFAFKLYIFCDKPIDIMNPFSTPFYLKNESWLWITNVYPYKVIIRNINHLSMKINVNLIAPNIRHISAGETTTFTLPVHEVKFPDKINFLKIDIGITYSPALIPFYKKQKYVRFVTIQSKDGKLRWIPKSMSE